MKSTCGKGKGLAGLLFLFSTCLTHLEKNKKKIYDQFRWAAQYLCTKV